MTEYASRSVRQAWREGAGQEREMVTQQSPEGSPTKQRSVLSKLFTAPSEMIEIVEEEDLSSSNSEMVTPLEQDRPTPMDEFPPLHLQPAYIEYAKLRRTSVDSARSRSNRSSPSHVRSQPSPPRDDMTQLREQVALLIKSLEEEKKRRACEQKLMQQKILELQGLIRHNLPEHQLALERRFQLRSPSKPVLKGGRTITPRLWSSSKNLQRAQERSPYKTMKLLQELQPEQFLGETDDDGGDHDDDDKSENQEPTVKTRGRRRVNSESAANRDVERTAQAKAKLQLTKLRARMQAVVAEAQQETLNLRQRLEEQQTAWDKKERQMRIDANVRIAAIEEKHVNTRKKLVAKTNVLTSHVVSLTEEKQRLQLELEHKAVRIKQLEMALRGRDHVLKSVPTATPSPTPSS